MSKGGRPRILDDDKRRDVCALAAAGCGLQDAARYVGCSVTTIRRALASDREFRKQLRSSELNAQLDPLRAMRKAASTHWRAAAWMLERTNPRRFARPYVKAYAAEEVDTVINDMIMAATRDIPEPEIRIRVLCQLRAAAEDAARALQTAEDRRLRPKQAKEAAERMQQAVDALNAVREGIARLDEISQNSKTHEAPSPTYSSANPASADLPTTNKTEVLHAEMGPP